MSVAIPIPLLQNLPDVNVTPAVGVDEYALVYDHDTGKFVLRAPAAGVTDHGALTGLTPDDDHTQYALLAGRAGGQTLYGGTAANDDLTLSGTSDATRTTSYVILQPTAGNVGIGTSAPGASLDVYSASRTTIKLGGTGNNYAYADFTFYTPNTLLATKAHLWSINFRQDDYFGGGIGALNFNSNISNGAGGTTGFRAPLMLKENGDVILAGASNVISNGNVGIGTTSPGSKLEVVGSIQIPNQFYLLGRSADATPVTMMGVDGSDNLQIGSGNKYPTIQFSTGGASGSNFVTMKNGNVGINDTDPAEALDVTGNINTTGVYKVDNVQVLSNRVIDARCADVANSGDATTDGLIDALRDALVAHGLIAASA